MDRSLAESKQSTKSVAIASNLLAQLPRWQVLELVSGLGYRSIDLWSAPIIAQHVDPRSDHPQDVGAELDEYGLEPLALSIYLTTYEEKVERLHFAARLGVPYVVFEPAPSSDFFEKMSNLPAEGRTLTPPGAAWGEFVDTLEHFLELADNQGLRVALEVPHVYTLIETASDLERLRADLQHPALYFTVAPPHAVARGSELEEIIRLCGDRLAILYLWNLKPDYTAEVDDRGFGVPSEQLALDGFFDFTPFIASADKRGHAHLCVKCHGTEAWTDPEQIVDVIREATGILGLSSG